MVSSQNEGLSLEALMRVSPTGEEGSFTGLSEDYGGIGVYGGHFLGQALAAGFQTVEEGKLASSFQSCFLNRGDPAAPTTYRVASLRDGARRDIRTISAHQGAVNVFYMIASFKLPEEGDSHQKSMPHVKSAETLIAERETRGEVPFPFPIIQGGRLEMEFASASFRDFDPEREEGLRIWMRKTGDSLASPRDQQIALAFMSDSTLMFNSVLPHGIPFQTHVLTSLDQTVWFHEAVSPDEWLLFDQRSIAAGDGRGLNEGEVYTGDGRLVMSCAQESMLKRMKA